LTQQNAALVEEAAASSKSMEEQSSALLDQIAFFNDREEVPVVKAPIRRSSAQRNSKPKPARPIRRTQSNSRSDNDWKDF
jgi:methyl-accepting chemotaxis protein